MGHGRTLRRRRKKRQEAAKAKAASLHRAVSRDDVMPRLQNCWVCGHRYASVDAETSIPGLNCSVRDPAVERWIRQQTWTEGMPEWETDPCPLCFPYEPYVTTATERARKAQQPPADLVARAARMRGN